MRPFPSAGNVESSFLDRALTAETPIEGFYIACNAFIVGILKSTICSDKIH
jgi:hypothetical protein